jgi:ribonuclease VapC
VIVVDSSALVAILRYEQPADELLTAVARASRRLISAGTAIETSMVVAARFGPAGSAELDVLAAKLDLELAPVDAAQVAAAREAFRRFGRGQHPAALNLGDLFAYALAKVRSLPLLYVGDDFARTDIESALTRHG